MYAVLIADTVNDLPNNYNKLLIRKVSNRLGNITPLHLGALIPNLDILKTLLNKLGSDHNYKFMTDSQGN